MKIWPPRCEIALKDDEGMIRFGRTEWVEGDRLGCQLDEPPQVGHLCDISIRTGEGQPSISAGARVLAVGAPEMGRRPVELYLEQLDEEQRRRWEAWLASVSASRSPSASTVSGSHLRRKRVAQAIRDAALARGADPERGSRPTADRPGFAWTSPEHLDVRWATPAALSRSLERGLGRGRIVVPDQPDAPARVVVTLHLPDGQVLRIPARVVERQRGKLLLRLETHLALRHKLRRAAQT